jgi:uncharacterized LabA/DUF88 family protein
MTTKRTHDEIKLDYGFTAILVDGGFYRKRSYAKKGDKSPVDRATELFEYCLKHLNDDRGFHKLYRIFYYDCPPLDTTVYNPLTKKTENLKASPTYAWTTEFLNELRKKRKVALRLGKINPFSARYTLTEQALKDLCNGKRTWSEIVKDDIRLLMDQKGVDMKIGLDIASLAYKQQVDQIILISGDSDFVSAAKLARREGIDFILDPMGSAIKQDLFEHIDGLKSADTVYIP